MKGSQEAYKRGRYAKTHVKKPNFGSSSVYYFLRRTLSLIYLMARLDLVRCMWKEDIGRPAKFRCRN